jgi:hypothetical protein
MAEAVESLSINGAGLHDILTLSMGGGVTAALNSVPKELIAQYQVVGLFNDDARMRTQGWDTIILNRMVGKCALIYGRDGIQNERLCTHPFISTRIIRAVGYIQPPQLYHYYGDNFWGELLAPLGAVRYCPDLFTEHRNAIALGLPQDSTTRMEVMHWESDSEAWRLFMQNEMPTLRDRVRDAL